MSQAPTTEQPATSRLATVLLAGVIAIAFVGYFIGINAGVPQPDQRLAIPKVTWNEPGERPAIEARSYAEMQQAALQAQELSTVSLARIPQPEFQITEDFQPDPEQKQLSLRARSELRAFNGAPPVIPHAVQNTNDAACYACHGPGVVIEGRVARRMSHAFLANCVQCHAPPPLTIFADSITFTDNDFQGVPAPTSGQRAYPGAPPTIPHSTWMRSSCLACHGGATGWAGLESTHPWRTACQQCHAPSATFDQAVSREVSFLQPPQIDSP